LHEKENSHDKWERSSTVDKEIAEYLNGLLEKERIEQREKRKKAT
jgi:hypothetical protein